MAVADERMLSALVAHEKLTEVESEAFQEMLDRLTSKRISKLSPAQRTWVTARYVAYELDVEDGAHNLVSSGVVAATSKTQPYELLPKPLKPPGRM